MWKKLALTIVTIVVLVLLVVLALPFVVDVDFFRPQIESGLRTSLGREVKIGHLHLSVIRGELTAADISIADDPRFGSTPFLRAKSFDVGIALAPLIFSRVLDIRSVVFEEPQVVLMRSSSGQWNFSSLGGAKSRRKMESSGPPSAGSRFTIQKLKISDGRLSIGSPGKKQQTYEGVDLIADNVSLDAAFPVTLHARTPAGGSLDIEGKAGPISSEDAAQTPFDAKITLKKVDLTSTGLLDPSSGIAGIMDYQGTIRSDGHVAHSEGTATVDKLRVVKTGTAASQPISVNYASEYDLAKQSGQLTKGQVVTGKSTVSASGGYDIRGASTVVHMKLDAPSIPVGDIQALLPAIGVTLPAGSSLQTGTVTTHLSLDGPVDQLVTTGDVNLANAKLSGFGLSSKLAALSVFTGLKASPDTLIQMMSSKLHISPDGIRSEDLNLVVPDVGTITGSGVIGANNALNFKLLASFASTGMGGVLSSLASRYGVGNAIANGIPFLVQGTTSAPVFLPDTGAMIRSAVPPQGQPGATTGTPRKNLGDVIGGFLGKKKNQ